MATNLYLFKKKSNGDFIYYKIPLTRNRHLLDTILTGEEGAIQNADKRDYLQIYSSQAQTNLYYSISNVDCSEELLKFLNGLILNNSDIPSISTYRPRSGDKFPFKGIVILKKEDDNFTIGIHTLADKLKLYKHSFLGITFSRDEYKIETTENLFLIPKFVSCLIKGKWDANEISINNTYCRSKYTLIMENIFGYKEKWKTEASSIRTSQNNLTITDMVWNDFSKDIRNTRKFVRCFRTAQGSFENVRAYYNIENLRNLLGFQVQEENGEIKVELNSKEQVKTFLDAFRKHIIQIPISQNEYGTAEYIERLV